MINILNKNILYVILGMIIIIVSFFALDRETEIVNYPPDGEVVVVFGDSLVEGVGASLDGGFVTLVSQDLGIDIINSGRSGDTTEMALTRLSEDVSEKNPDVVLILLGGNDYLKRKSKDETFENLGIIVRQIQDTGAVVLLLGVRGGLLKDNYGNDFRKFAKRYGTAYVPNVLDGLVGNSEYMDDQIHPNDTGYRIIADRVTPALEKLIK